MDAPIDAAGLRALQAPLKELYREDPHEAHTPISARADWRDHGITTNVDVWSGRTRAGLHPATGGDGDDACSGDMLLEALIACAGVTMRSVATAMGLSITRADLRADGEFDARGTLGIDREVPVGVTGLSITATLETDASDADLERLARSTERYCVVGQSLATPPTVTIRRANPN
ncbi:OsmC family protein [Knoellia subterranea]|nr:OsmC family protein [Knoellia subterranea]